MSDNKPELAHNFAPTLPKSSLEPEVNLDKSVKAEEKSKPSWKIWERTPEKPQQAEAKTDTPVEIQDSVDALYQKLLQKVELKADLYRQTKKREKSGQNLSAAPVLPSDQELLTLINSGKFNEATAYLSSDETIDQISVAETEKQLAELEGEIQQLVANPQVAAEYNRFRTELIDRLRFGIEVMRGRQVRNNIVLAGEKIQRRAKAAKRGISPGEHAVIDTAEKASGMIGDKIEQDLQNPEVYDSVRLLYLQELQRQSKVEKYAVTPSRESYIDQIRRKWAEGAKILLTGATGTGKTELMKYASKALFGKNPKIISGHAEISTYEIYGKMGGGEVNGERTLVFKPGPLLQAAIEDCPIVIDEINVIPNEINMRMKSDWNLGPGDIMTAQEDSDHQITLGENFAWGATANIRGEKHPDRIEIANEIDRIFAGSSIKVDYLPAPELYDIMLSSLLDIKSGAILSRKDAESTLKGLCDAADWIQKAYDGQSVITDPDKGTTLSSRDGAATGKEATLRKAVLDPGKAIGMLNGWELSRRKGLTLAEHLNTRISEFINNESYPDEDRYYLAEIFALQGFLRGVDVASLNVPGLTQDVLDGWSGYDGRRYVSKTNYLTAHEVATLDPYGLRRAPDSDIVADLLDEEEAGDIIEGEEGNSFLPFGFGSTIKERSRKDISINIPKPDAEGQKLIDEIDKKYDPNHLPGDVDEKYQRYPNELVDAAANPTTHFAVAERFAKIFGADLTQRIVYLNAGITALGKFTSLAKNNLPACQIIIQIVQNIMPEIDRRMAEKNVLDQAKESKITLEAIKRIVEETTELNKGKIIQPARSTSRPARSSAGNITLRSNEQPDAAGRSTLAVIDAAFPLNNLPIDDRRFSELPARLVEAALKNPSIAFEVGKRLNLLLEGFTKVFIGGTELALLTTEIAKLAGIANLSAQSRVEIGQLINKITLKDKYAGTGYRKEIDNNIETIKKAII